MNETLQRPAFSLDKIYIKTSGIEIPNTPLDFLVREEPAVGVQLNIFYQHLINDTYRLGDNAYEVLLWAEVTAKHGESVVYRVALVQAGIFRISNVTPEDLEPLLMVSCPKILFPYAREAVSDIVARAGFLPVLLQPFNFESMYLNSLQARQAEQAAANAGAGPALAVTHGDFPSQSGVAGAGQS